MGLKKHYQDKEHLKNSVTNGILAFVFCTFLCLTMIVIYGAVVYKEHVKMINITRGIIRERSDSELNKIFSSYFYWDEMIEHVQKEDLKFINSELEEMIHDYQVVGLSIRNRGKEVFSWGMDQATLKTKIRYTLGSKNNLLAGKSFYMENDRGIIKPDLEYSVWIDLSKHLKVLEPFLLQFQLIPSSEAIKKSDKVFLGNAYVKNDKSDFIKILIKKTPRIPLMLCILSVLIYFVLLLAIEKYSIRLSWYERLRSLTGILEEKDAYTFGHGNRVAVYSVAIARELQLKKREIRKIALAAQCHDIGKIFLPDEILNKREPLTKVEFKRIERHPEDSERIFLNLIKNEKVGKIIRSHHEKWDGTGYPDGLKREEIPFEARIIAIADSFDAMTTHRSYRSAIPVKKTLRIIEENSGSQFDPFIMRQSIKALRENYIEEKNALVDSSNFNKKNFISMLFHRDLS